MSIVYYIHSYNTYIIILSLHSTVYTDVSSNRYTILSVLCFHIICLLSFLFFCLCITIQSLFIICNMICPMYICDAPPYRYANTLNVCFHLHLIPHPCTENYPENYDLLFSYINFTWWLYASNIFYVLV